ncbi:outer membrane receptor protein involved in Fe transport [Sphingopyxis panaciterrae]|uniref:TonB-dependent receptor n=1 Tax=Sphingopyxis panaciterrae TaxID=363841 RepID=UPI00141E14B2|nr:TonB-dependent receptor [Sphingopyxis panaciterrae]NIJ37418.1 outer membrane receptor protein involved in Fe transport [Sphingopyxis panaciterrae]
MNVRQAWAGCLVALLLSTTAATAHAQDRTQDIGPTDPGDEIIVTAQKRSERLVDVPMSVTAATGEQLSRQGIVDTSQLAKIVPGFTYQQSNYGNPVFAIRGVGFVDNSVTAGSTVSVYVDQIPLPFVAMTRGATLDLERVEALKGPQGTLFGQNSTGGAINYIAAKPTSEPKAGIDLSFGRFNEIIAGGFVSGPIGENMRARLALRSESMKGWQQSLTRPGDTLGRKRFFTGRFLLDWDPSETLKFELHASASHDGSESPAAQLVRAFSRGFPNARTAPLIAAYQASAIPARGPREADWDAGFDFSRDDDFYLVALRGDWQMAEQLTLTSITAYSHMTTHRPIDLDGVAVEGNGFNFRYDRQDGLLKSFSQELRLAGDMGAIKWVLGANYQKQTANEFQLLSNPGSQGSFDFTNLAPILGPEIGRIYYWNQSTYLNKQRPISKAVFGSFDYEVTDSLTVRASARYTDEKRKFSGCLADGGQTTTAEFDAIRDAWSLLAGGVPIASGSCLTLNDSSFLPGLVSSRLNEDNFSWRASLDYKPSSDSLIYLAAAKGYKSGGYSIVPAIFASQIAPVTQESLQSYEAGFRVSLAGRGLQISGATFYYDYSDKQLIGWANTAFGPLPQLVNIPKSRVIGAELELTARPVEGLRLNAGLTYIDSKVRRDPDLPLDSFGQAASYVGESFPNTPDWNGLVDAEYSFPISGAMNAFVGGSATFRSGTSSFFGGLPDFRIPGYSLFDVRAGFESADGDWRIQAYGRNITNKWYWVNVGVETDAIHRAPGMGATYGLAVSYRF